MPSQGISGRVWGGNAPRGKPGTLKKGDDENWRGGDGTHISPAGTFPGPGGEGKGRENLILSRLSDP